MSERPSTNIWNRRWRGPRGVLAWVGLLVAAIAVILFCIGLVTANNTNIGELAFFSVVAAVAFTLLVSVAVLFVRWLCCWRNLRRGLFALACLVTLIALFYAEENWRGKHDWEKQRRVWEAQGEKFTIAALVPPPVPDDKNLAMAPLLKPILDYTQAPGGSIVWGDTNGQARARSISANLEPRRGTNNLLVLGSLEKGTFADLAACAAFYRDNTNYPQAPASATAAETILVALDKFRPELDQLREAAAARSFCRFPIHYDYQPCWAILLPHLATMKTLTQLVHVRALAELEAGHSAEAYDDLLLGLRFSQSIHDEPILIDHLVRIAALAIDLQTIREGLLRHAWTDPQLAQIETNLTAVNLLAEHKMAIYGELAFQVEGLDYFRRQGWRSNPIDLMDTSGNPSSKIPPQLYPGGWYYQNTLTISRMLNEYALPAVDERARRVFPEMTERGTSAISAMPTNGFTIFAKALLPALAKPVERSARIQTYVDCACVACALERYRLAKGNLPETLGLLSPQFIQHIPNDVIDGKPLRYHRDPNGGYVVYSIGWNQADDGGQVFWDKAQSADAERLRNKEPRLDFTKGDWVWLMPAEKDQKTAAVAHASTPANN